jgi:hypothetical protein
MVHPYLCTVRAKDGVNNLIKLQPKDIFCSLDEIYCDREA